MFALLRRLTLSQWIIVAMFMGIGVGWLISSGQLPPNVADVVKQACKMGSSAFLHLVKCIIVPLIFSTFVIGIAGHGDDMKKVGKLALRSIVYFEVVTTLALAVGLFAVNLVKPGVGISLGSATAEAGEQFAQKKVTLAGVLEHTVPQSFFEAAASNEVLQVVVFAILFAVALARVKEGPKKTMLTWLESLSEVMFKFVGLVMSFAPL